MLKLFFANLKMTYRNRQALFWSLMFPLLFTFIFGFFFGQGSANTGTVALINRSDSELANSISKTLKESDLFKIKDVTDLVQTKKELKKSQFTAIIDIPEGFGSLNPNSPKTIQVIDDPANLQTNIIVISFLDQFLTEVNFKTQKVQPLFKVQENKISSHSLNYFDFVLIGLIGMALMNSSIQGVSISMTKYQEDKILKRLTTTPLKSWKFILAEVLARLVINLVQVSLILLIGIEFFKAHIYGSLFLVYLFSLLGAVLFQAIGFAIASVSKTSAAAEGMSTAVAIPMMFLAGVFFPIDQLPEWLSSVVKYLPLAPLLRMIRQIALEAVSPFTDITNIIIVLAWIIIMLIIASRRFRLSEE